MSQSIKASAATSAQNDPFDALWRFFSSTRLAIILILVVAVVSFLGSLFPQATDKVLANPTDYARWVDTLRPSYGAMTDLYSIVGMFYLYRVFWFQALLLVLVFNTVICTVNRLPSLLQSIRTPRVRMEEAFFRNAKNQASFKLKGGPGRSGAVAETLIQSLSAKSYKVVVEDEGETKHIFADRYSIFKLGTLVTHTSIVVLLVGAAMGTLFGYADDGVVVPVGKAYQAPLGETFQVRADNFVADYYEDGKPKDYYSDLAVIEGGREVFRQRIRVNDPLEYRGFRFHQSFFGPVASLDVTGSAGNKVFSDDLALPNSSGRSSVGFTPLPGTSLYLVASLLQGPTEQLNVQLLEGDIVVASGLLKTAETKKIGSYDIAFKGTKQFTGLRVVKDPGVPVVWLASAMLVIGICLTLYFPRRRLWARVSPREVAVAGMADRMVNLQEELNRLVEEVRGREAQVEPSRRKVVERS